MATRTPPMISLYRARAREVRALDMGDGRHLVLEDPPRYVDSAAFDQAFELVPERRAFAGRRASNGKPRKVKQERRKGATRRAENGGDPVRSEARRLVEEEGLTVGEASVKVKRKYQTVYGWSRKDEWKRATKKPPAPAAAARRKAGAAPRPPEPLNPDGGWMN